MKTSMVKEEDETLRRSGSGSLAFLRLLTVVETPEDIVLGLDKSSNVKPFQYVTLGRIGYPGNFKVSGSGSLSGGSIILLSLSGSGVLGYPGGGYPGGGYLSKNCNIRRISGSGFGSLK
ncbi:hypothetical protein F2Q70_00012080 [Brassica cretica]|uniref:Uncharacterized protein n=1 Tax=Brassica cretica TaxID=69181 RepID=A0A8S9M9M8_BRACR|nr:hypothetical protein F2Q70_00012080 [Brassica cretica]